MPLTIIAGDADFRDGREVATILAYPISLALLWPAVLLSGATALIYEIVWTRQLSLILGSTTSAAAAVLSAFMLGLALGAVLVGRRADASRHPLRWYGILEIGIGVYALVFPMLTSVLAERLAGAPWLAAFVVLLLPAALMGGTLPVLARAAADTTQRGTRALGLLYGMNTLGAVIGALLTVLFLMERFGLRGSTNLAALINVALGLLFWFLSRVAGERPQFPTQGILEDDAARTTSRSGLRYAVLGAFFAAGFAGLALQLAWTRLLVYYLEGFTVAFGLMLAAYLLGLGAGALVGTPVALRSANPRRLLGRILLVQAVLAVTSAVLAEFHGLGLEDMRAGYVEAEAIDFGYGLSLFMTAIWTIFPATLCAGMLLPVVARMALIDREAIGRHSGVVYAASTLGAVVAPPVAGFMLLPTYGVVGTIAILATVLFAAGAMISLRRRVADWAPVGIALLLLLGGYGLAKRGQPLVERSHVFANAREPKRLVSYSPGYLSDVSVIEEVAHGTRRLYLDGFSAAETGRNYGYMRMLGHLPVLLHPEPKQVCVIAFGTGTTAGAVSLHPEVERLVCVEIEPQVFQQASAFAAVNHDVLQSKIAVRVVADGRQYVRRGENKFDVISLEPLMPYTPAAVYLYTKEFYEDARRSLASGGMLCQWIPPQGVSPSDLRRLVASMAEVFPHTSLWYFEHALLVLGADGPPRPDMAKLSLRAARSEISYDLDAAHVGNAAHLLGAHIVSGRDLIDLLQGDDPLVDDRTDLEFRPLPRRFGKRSQTYHAKNLAFFAGAHQDQVSWLEGTGPAVALALRSGGESLATLALEMQRRVDGGKVVPAGALRDVLAADPEATWALAITHRRLYPDLLAQGRFEEAIQLRYAPDRCLAYLELARSAEGEQRRSYLLSALRENTLLGANPMTSPPEFVQQSVDLLHELAGSLEGAEKRFCTNRAHILAGTELESGEETLPRVKLADLVEALDRGDFVTARERLQAGRAAGQGRELDRQAWEWWESAEDSREAFRGLFEIGADSVVRAARKLYGKGRTEDLVAVASYFCSLYPDTRSQWPLLCQHRVTEVREAAADAAKEHGSRAHAPLLARMCADPAQQVRLSAWLALRDLVPEVEASGYDFKSPTPESLAALQRIVD